MINLFESTSQIVKNNPEHAAPLYDALLFMAQPKAVLSPEYHQTVQLLYSMTSDSERHRERYERARAA